MEPTNTLPWHESRFAKFFHTGSFTEHTIAQWADGPRDAHSELAVEIWLGVILQKRACGDFSAQERASIARGLQRLVKAWPACAKVPGFEPAIEHIV